MNIHEGNGNSNSYGSMYKCTCVLIGFKLGPHLWDQYHNIMCL